MKTISLELDSSVLDLADRLLAEVDSGGLEDPISHFSGDGLEIFSAGPPSLHDLFDVSLPADHPDYSSDVELIFPSTLLDQVEAENSRCDTPVVEVDLACNESMISTTPETSEVDSEEAPEDPLSPGDGPRPCRACTYHRIETGDPDIKCSLCYMKDTYYQVYSKC